MKGAYVLLIELSEKVTISHKGSSYELPAGIYVYVGSALGYKNAIENRVSRHVRKNKRIFWHIDKITSLSQVYIPGFFSVITNTSIECDISHKLFTSRNFSVPIPKFGASDCKQGCPAHFYRCQVSDLHWCISVLQSILSKLTNTVLFCKVEGGSFSCKIINRTFTQKLM